MDETTGKQLVIEHKNVLMPADYAKRHQNDHDVYRRICRAFDGIKLRRPMRVVLSYLFAGNARSREEYARVIIEAIRWADENLADDQEVRGEAVGCLWAVGVMQDWDWNDGDIECDLNFTWPIPHPNSAEVRAEVLPQLVRFYESCAEKFRGYPEARRVLVLYWHGAIYPSYLGELLASVEKPPEVDEVWVPYQEEDDEGRPFLWFERIVPPPERASPAA